MATPAQDAIGKLDGRNPDLPNYPPLNWVGVTQYQEWDFGKNWVNRPQGADNGVSPANGAQWWSPSQIDHVTVMAEILTKKYHGCTVLHMISALFAHLIEGREVSELRSLLGVTGSNGTTGSSNAYYQNILDWLTKNGGTPGLSGNHTALNGFILYAQAVKTGSGLPGQSPGWPSNTYFQSLYNWVTANAGPGAPGRPGPSGDAQLDGFIDYVNSHR